MVEFAVVLAIKRLNDVNAEDSPEGPLFDLESKNKKKTRQQMAGIKKTMLLTRRFQTIGKKKSMLKAKCISLTDKIDAASLIIFMVSYFLFCFIYFAHYL